jgi:hypothetical protein
MSRWRKRRSARATEDWLTPPRQREKALAIIDPAPDERDQCERAIDLHLDMVQEAKTDEDLFKPIPREVLNRYIDKLRAVEQAARPLLPSFRGFHERFLDQVKLQREICEGCVAEIQHTKTRRDGSKQSAAKQAAAAHSWMLLRQFGHRPPALTEHKDWHRLAATLFGYATVRLFSFDYLKRTHNQIRKAAAARAKEDPPKPDTRAAEQAARDRRKVPYYVYQRADEIADEIERALDPWKQEV